MITAIIGLAWRISSKLTEVSTKLDGLDHAQSLNTKLEMMDASEAAAIPDDITAMRDSLSDINDDLDGIEDVRNSVSTIERSVTNVDFQGIERAVEQLSDGK